VKEIKFFEYINKEQIETKMISENIMSNLYTYRKLISNKSISTQMSSNYLVVSIKDF
jgi:hypothetical protein